MSSDPRRPGLPGPFRSFRSRAYRPRQISPRTPRLACHRLALLAVLALPAACARSAAPAQAEPAAGKARAASIDYSTANELVAPGVASSEFSEVRLAAPRSTGATTRAFISRASGPTRTSASSTFTRYASCYAEPPRDAHAGAKPRGCTRVGRPRGAERAKRAEARYFC